MEQARYENFSGGIADGFLSCDPSFSYSLDNLWLDENARPYTRPGTAIYHTRVPVSGANKRLTGLYIGPTPYHLPLCFRTASLYQVLSTDVIQEITGPTSNAAMPAKTHTDLEAATLWKKQIVFCSPPSTTKPSRVYCSAYSTDATFKVLTLGLPALASAPTCTLTNAGTENYVYAFHYYYLLTDYDGTQFEEKGPITQVAVTLSDPPQTNEIEIAAIPVIANGSVYNYATTAIKVKIFRTLTNGTTFYYVGEVTNGTAVFTDNFADATIELNDTIYIDGGVLEYYQPPAGSRYVAQVNDFFWYATDRILTHSIQGAPGAVPAEYAQSIDRKPKGLSSILGFPMLFTDGPIYRVEGTYDEFGDGGFELREIDPVAGCVSHRSITRVPGGVVWAGNSGFYFSDGHRVIRISDSIPVRYQVWKNSAIAGVYDSSKNMVHWLVSSSANNQYGPNDSVASLDLSYGIKPRSVFVTWGSYNNIWPTAIAYSDSDETVLAWRDKVLLGEVRGYLLYQSEKSYTDPLISEGTYPYLFKKKAIHYRLESAAYDLGDAGVRKYCSYLTAEFETQTEVSVQFWSRRDDGGAWSALSEIRVDGPMIWGITEYPWNSPTDTASHDWDSVALAEGKRGFPKNSLRSNRRQVALTNSKTWITKSDDLGKVTVDAVAKTLTLESSGVFWPFDCEEYEILLETDSYAQAFVVRDRTSDTKVTVYDPLSQLASTSGVEWQMRGYRKNEQMHLLSYTIWFEKEAETYSPNRGTSGLINA